MIDDHHMRLLDRGGAYHRRRVQRYVVRSLPRAGTRPVEHQLANNMRRNSSSTKAQQAWTNNKAAANMQQTHTHL